MLPVLSFLLVALLAAPVRLGDARPGAPVQHLTPSTAAAMINSDGRERLCVVVAKPSTRGIIAKVT